MTRRARRGPVAVLAVVWLLTMIVDSSPSGAAARENDEDELSVYTLIVGGQDEMKTRNPLPAQADDVWTTDVHYQAYHSLMLWHPTLDRPMAYIAKGVDGNENGVFEVGEYDQWHKDVGTNILDVIVYYDFNGVFWHDGVQMTPWDVLFSYHLNAQNPRFNTGLWALYCEPTESYQTCGRKLAIEVYDTDGDPSNGYQKNWENEATLPGDSRMRVGLHYSMNQAFALFNQSTLFPVLMPMHVWSRTFGGVHSDFGCAIWIPPSDANARGIPECGSSDPALWGIGIAETDAVPGSTPYQYTAAESWAPRDQDVIGHGPFRLDYWVPNVEAKVVRYERYYTGMNPDDPLEVYDARLSRRLVKPTIDGILYKVYRTMQLGVFALTSGEIHLLRGIGPEFLPDLFGFPEIAVESNAEPGFSYMSYNFRREPWGYRNGDPAQGDAGYGFRQAVSHLVNKRGIVQTLLQNFGVIGHGTVNPANSFWYNDNIPKPDYDLAAAQAILDDLATPGGPYHEIGYTLDPPGDCSTSTPWGCRGIGTRGTALFEILTPQADYNPVHATAGAWIADGMRQVGINAISRQMAFGEIVTRVNAKDFDLFILSWRIDGTDPDYLFRFFHSSTSQAGQNYPGFRNSTFDGVISQSRAEFDRSTRQTLIYEVQRILALERPYEVLYYRANIEAYRKDRFVNWTAFAGTLWNYWSLEGIHPPGSINHMITVDTIPPGLQVSVNGLAYVAPRTFQCAGGTFVTLSAPSSQGTAETTHLFGAWSDGEPQTHDIACEGDATYVADFTTDHRVIIETSPPGLGIVLDGVTHIAPHEFWCRANDTHAIGTTPTQEMGSARFLFSSWSDGGAITHPFPCVGPSTVVAAFSTQFWIAFESVPSGLTFQIDGVDFVTPYMRWCNEGDTLLVTVPVTWETTDIRRVFSEWSAGGPSSRAFACETPATHTASYAAAAYRIALDTTPASLLVAIDGTSAAAPHSFWCGAETSVVIEAPSPQVSGGTRQVFASWSNGGAAAHTIQCNAPAAYAATFATEYRIVVDTSPPGLRIVVGGVVTTGPFTTWCAEASEVQVEAPTQQGATSPHRFVSWSDGGNRTHAISCIGEAVLTATFELVPARSDGGDFPLWVALVVAVFIGVTLFLWRRRGRV